MAESKLISPQAIDSIFRRFARAEPHPKTELVFTNPFTLLVAIVLSAQATDVSVNKATKTLFAEYGTPEKMAALGEAGLMPFIASIGLYRAKTKYVIALAKQLVEQYGSTIPPTREALMTLPGVGRKTANVWLNTIKGEGTIAVDTHVFRVANRTGLCHTGNPLATELALEKRIPAKWMQHAHHWLILHGRYVCKARRPECWRCLIVEECGYKKKELTPPKAKK
ncbi:MAG: endonuclease III [Alphaproteobacteria bacterium]